MHFGLAVFHPEVENLKNYLMRVVQPYNVFVADEEYGIKIDRTLGIFNCWNNDEPYYKLIKPNPILLLSYVDLYVSPRLYFKDIHDYNDKVFHYQYDEDTKEFYNFYNPNGILKWIHIGGKFDNFWKTLNGPKTTCYVKDIDRTDLDMLLTSDAEKHQYYLEHFIVEESLYTLKRNPDDFMTKYKELLESTDPGLQVTALTCVV